MITMAMPMPAQVSHMRRCAARLAGPAGAVRRSPAGAVPRDPAAAAGVGGALTGAVAGTAPGGGAGIPPAALISLLIVPRSSVS